MKRTVITITGDLASGKSTLAADLGARLGAMVLIKDKFKEALSVRLDYDNLETNHKLSLCAVDMMLQAFEDFIPTNAVVVLEANFHNDELLRIKAIAARNNYRCVVINLYGDLKTLYQRYNIRQIARHPTHKVVQINDFETYQHYINLNRAEIANIDKYDLCIDGKHISDVLDEVYDIVLKAK